jgi:phage terminase large subunit
VHRDYHTYIGNFGGYGTGKTLTSREEIYKHLFLTPNANILIGANVSSQYEQTIKRDIEADLPKAFVKSVSTQKQYIDFINGSRIMFRPLDDVDKIRSYNLTMFVIVEASEVDPEAFTQLKTRLRNLNAAIPYTDEEGEVVYEELDNGLRVPKIKTDWLKGIIESNPDSGWIRTEVLYVSDSIKQHGHIIDEVTVPDNVKDPAVSTHVASTDCNAFLPPTFIDNLCKNKPGWWINRYIFSSFSYAEGLVYPTACNRIVPTYQVPQEWKRIVAADYGLSDDFVYLFMAIDEMHGKAVVYKVLPTNNKNIEDLAKIFYQETQDIPVGGYYTAPILDPKSGAKRDYNKKTLYDHFLDYGIAFQPGHINVDARVFRLNTYLESGKLEIMDCCTYLIDELRDYKFPPKKIGDSHSKAQDKPVDKNNHAINPLEWACMALPADPAKLMYGAYDKYGNDLTKPMKDDNGKWCPPQLRDDDEPYYAYERTEW